MRGDLHLGKIITKGEQTEDDFLFKPINSRKLTVRGAIPSNIIGNVSNGSPKYVDFLFYNRVNEVGDVLTSCIFMGDFRSDNRGVTFTYDPTKLFNNSITELSLGINASNNLFTGFNHITLGDTRLLGDQDVNTNYVQFNRTGPLANMIGVQDVAFDGWYTLISIFAIESISHYSFLTKDTIAKRDSTMPQQCLQDLGNYTVDDHWISISDFTNELVQVGRLARNNAIFNNFKKVDFFVTYDFKKLYTQELEKSTELRYKAGHDTIIEKGKMIENMLLTDDFKSAQRVLQSAEDTMLLNNL